jgi:hypothetical protein
MRSPETLFATPQPGIYHNECEYFGPLALSEAL